MSGNAKYDEILKAVKTLPVSKQVKLKNELEKNLVSLEEKKKHEKYLKFLLDFPVASKEDLKSFNEARKHINKWRTK